MIDMHRCQQEKIEDPETYTNKSEARIARYVHQKTTKIPSDDQKLELLLIKNGNLTEEKRNSITFQLTTGEAMRKTQDAPQ